MSSRVIGRTVEMQVMREALEASEASFLVIYGRRRVGKTFLVREYLAKSLVFDLTGAAQVGLKGQLDHFYAQYILRSRGHQGLVFPQSWDEAFRYLANYLQNLKRKKVVVFLDELPWLDTPKSGFIPALDHFWNQYASKLPQVLLVGSGSATSWMEKKLIKAQGGLHNRITHRIQLKPFNLAETELFCLQRKVRLTRYQIIQLYMVMGGIPYYLNALKPGKSVTQLVDEICFNSHGLLNDEYNILYKSLFKYHEHHLKVIKALAVKPEGLTRYEIEKITKLAEGGTITRTLDELEINGFISRYKPFNRLVKDSIYKLTDLYTQFYLRFIEPHKSGGQGSWASLAQGRLYSTWCGYAYENLCFLHIDQIKQALGILGVYTEISAWRYRGDDDEQGAQIDLVIDRQDGIIHLCEIKFTNSELNLNKELINELRRKRGLFNRITGTRKSTLTTLITTYPAKRNSYYFEEIQAEINMEQLFHH